MEHTKLDGGGGRGGSVVSPSVECQHVDIYNSCINSIQLPDGGCCTITLEVSLVRYSNPTSEDCDGGNCEGLIGTCDNIFTFCLQETSSSSCEHGRITTSDIESDSFLFSSSSVLRDLGLSSNVITFTGFVPTVSRSTE